MFLQSANRVFRQSLPICLAGVSWAQTLSDLDRPDGEELGELLETVVVATGNEARALQTAGSAAAISADELLGNGALNLVDILQREPGVSIPFDVAGTDGLVPYLQGGSNSINIRGLEGNRVNLTVDGIRQPEDFTARSFSGSGGPGRVYFDPAVFSQVEVFKSAASSRFGSDAVAGAVMGRTEGPLTLLGPGVKGRTYRSSNQVAGVNESLNQRLAGAWGNGRHATSFVYSGRIGHETENNSNEAANPMDFTSHAFVGQWLSLLDEWTIESTIDIFQYDSFTDLTSIETTTLVGQNVHVVSDGERERFRISAEATWEPHEAPAFMDEITIRPYWQSSYSANYNIQQLLINPGTPGETLRDRINDLYYETDIGGLDLRFSKALDSSTITHRMNYGYEGSISFVRSALIRTDFPASPDNLLNMAPSEVCRHGLYFSDEITFGDRDQWVITPSIRVEGYRVEPDNTEDYLSQTSYPIFDAFGRLIGTESVEAVSYDHFTFAPAISALYRFTPDFNTYVSVSQGIRNPTAEDLMGVFIHEDDFITLPNPDLEEETSVSCELGLQYDGSGFRAQIATYWNFYDKFIERGIATGEFLDGRQVQRAENVNEAEIYGIELQAEGDLGCYSSRAEGFILGASFSYSEGIQTDDSGFREPLNTVEPWKSSIWLGYDALSGKWGVDLIGTYVSGKDEEDIAGDVDPTDPYVLVDLNGYYRISEHLLLRAGVKNLLDQEYVLWSRANRGSGHNGGVVAGIDTQPGINGFLSLEFEF